MNHIPQQYQSAQIAYAYQNEHFLAQAVENIFMQNKMVYAVRHFEIYNNLVFAVLTNPIFTKSERDKLKATLLELAKAITSSKVTITFDNQVFRDISNDLSEEQKASLLSLAKERN